MLHLCKRVAKWWSRRRADRLTPHSKVLEVDDNGGYVRIQFVRADGEVVSGEFAYWDWPQEIYANVNAPPGHIDIDSQTENRVLEVTGDGDSARVQFTLADGEVVTGEYKRYGWYKAPQKVIEEDRAIMGIPVVSKFDYDNSRRGLGSEDKHTTDTEDDMSKTGCAFTATEGMWPSLRNVRGGVCFPEWLDPAVQEARVARLRKASEPPPPLRDPDA